MTAVTSCIPLQCLGSAVDLGAGAPAPSLARHRPSNEGWTK